LTLSPNINNREFDKFVDDDGETAVRVKGKTSTSGQTGSGLFTIVSINASTWTALPLMADRNCMAVQNRSGQEIKVNFQNTASGFEGMSLDHKDSRIYDHRLQMYAKCLAGTADINVEEVA
jgi:hypothetical protein